MLATTPRTHRLGLHGCVVSALLALSLFSASTAHAQTAPASESDRLIETGLSLREAHRDAEALPYFERAHALSPTPRAAAQLGFVLQALGQWARAETQFSRALSASEDAWVRDRRPVLEESLAFVEARLGSLVLESNVAGAEVRIDDTPVGVTPLPSLRLASGRHRLHLQAAGREPYARLIDIAAGTTTRAVIALSLAAAPPRNAAPLPNQADQNLALTATPTANPAPFYRRWWFWTGVAALAVTGTVIAIAASSGGASYPCGGGGRICATE